MSNQQQTIKNTKLSAKLADYIFKNPQSIKGTPDDASYVVFSAKDKELNKLNEKIITNLIKKGQNVIKANETNNKKLPWKLIAITP